MQAHDPYGLIGSVLDGQFRVDRAIGEGGFSVVYRGQHLGLDEPVAIKCLKLQQQLGSALVETFVRRFRDESKIHYKLSQKSLAVARTVAAGTAMSPVTQGLVPYMVLEWLDGFPLAEELRARRERGDRGRPLAEVVRYLDPVADAMATAHAMGVVHRDLTPSNIFAVQTSGAPPRLKVLDFGVAKVVSDHALSLGPRAATMGQIKMFTPAYGAPEQFDSTIGATGPQTDVYAFALIVVELLGDRPPIAGEHLGEFLEAATTEARRPTPRALGLAVSDRVEALFESALAVRPTDRPADLGEFWGQLKNALLQDEEARRSSVPPSPGPSLTSKGTLILPSSSPPPRPASSPPSAPEGAKTVRLPSVPPPPDAVARIVAQPFTPPQISFQSSPPPPVAAPASSAPEAMRAEDLPGQARAPLPATRRGGDGVPTAVWVVAALTAAVVVVAGSLLALRRVLGQSSPVAPPTATTRPDASKAPQPDGSSGTSGAPSDP